MNLYIFELIACGSIWPCVTGAQALLAENYEKAVSMLTSNCKNKDGNNLPVWVTTSGELLGDMRDGQVWQLVASIKTFKNKPKYVLDIFNIE